jgi:hypothetical protein
MPHLIFKLRGVPDDEADEVRRLLQEHNINFYETQAGRWGISLAALWVRNDDERTQAQLLIDGYEINRYHQQQAHYQELISQGEEKTLIDIIRQSPLQFIAIIFAILLVLYLSNLSCA